MRFFYVLISLFLIAGTAFGSESGLDGLKNTLLSYFKPMKGSISAIIVGQNGTTVISDLGETSEVKRGMRFTVKGESGTFHHPITGEPVGRVEKPVGVAEVMEITPDRSVLRVVEGEANVGDILRVSSARVTALYQQTKDMDWFLSDEYLRVIAETGRFDILEAAPVMDEKDAMENATRLRTDLAIVISPSDSGLRQRLLWVKDKKEFSSASAKVDEGFLNDLKLGKELFAPIKVK